MAVCQDPPIRGTFAANEDLHLLLDADVGTRLAHDKGRYAGLQIQVQWNAIRRPRIVALDAPGQSLLAGELGPCRLGLDISTSILGITSQRGRLKVGY